MAPRHKTSTLASRLLRAWHSLRRRALPLLRLPVVRYLRCVQLRRLQPIGGGRQRGTPIVRYYWSEFLRHHQADIQGKALEIGTTSTLRAYGGAAVTEAHAIDLQTHHPDVTVVGDLSRCHHLPDNQYDCFVNQFTMHLIYDVQSALYHSVRLLKPGGVLLVNFPCVDYYFARGLDMGTGAALHMYWWFTPLHVENLLRALALTEADYQLHIYGNLFTRVAYQMNLASEELTKKELEYADPGHPLLICVRLTKPARWTVERPPERHAWQPQGAPAQWNPTTGHYGA